MDGWMDEWMDSLLHFSCKADDEEMEPMKEQSDPLPPPPEEQPAEPSLDGDVDAQQDQEA